MPYWPLYVRTCRLSATASGSRCNRATAAIAKAVSSVVPILWLTPQSISTAPRTFFLNTRCAKTFEISGPYSSYCTLPVKNCPQICLPQQYSLWWLHIQPSCVYTVSTRLRFLFLSLLKTHLFSLSCERATIPHPRHPSEEARGAGRMGSSGKGF